MAEQSIDTGPEMAGTEPPIGAEFQADGADEARSGGTGFKEQASNFARQAGDKARQFADTGKSRAGDALGEVARLMQDAATTVDEKLGSQYGQYARSAADGLESFSENLKARDIDELIDEAQALVRKSPAVAIGIAAALGFVIARVAKAGFESDTPGGSDPHGA